MIWTVPSTLILLFSSFSVNTQKRMTHTGISVHTYGLFIDAERERLYQVSLNKIAEMDKLSWVGTDFDLGCRLVTGIWGRIADGWRLMKTDGNSQWLVTAYRPWVAQVCWVRISWDDERVGGAKRSGVVDGADIRSSRLTHDLCSDQVFKSATPSLGVQDGVDSVDVSFLCDLRRKRRHVYQTCRRRNQRVSEGFEEWNVDWRWDTVLWW